MARITKALVLLTFSFVSVLGGPYTWQCNSGAEKIGGHDVEGRCIRKVFDVAAGDFQQGLLGCKMTCGKYGTLWPRPTGDVVLSKDLVNFLPGDLSIKVEEGTDPDVENLITEFKTIFGVYLYMMHPLNDPAGVLLSRDTKRNNFPKDHSDSVVIKVVVKVQSNETRLTLDTDESYKLVIKPDSQDHFQVRVEAETYFGARHGLETLSQLITYNELTDSLQMHQSASVTDKPIYPHRGILVDTSRNYIDKEILKRIIDGLSYNKLNVFHWHIIDTSSFPLVLDSIPELAQWGAYSKHKVYTPKDIKELIEYARVRGVKIVPEFDAPAHVGNGWQFAEKKHPEWGRLAVCNNQEEWQDYAVEPPAGQFNIVNEKMYELLGTLYKEMFQIFDPDVFHFGGDEVNMNCWNTSQEIKDWLAKENKVGTEDDLLDLWRTFQNRAYALAVEANDKKKVTGILWTNRMTELGVEKYLPNDEYIIQIWTTGADESIKNVINKGYRTIFSNYDAWYLDCGYESWINNGTNWCNPYKGWKEIYNNSPRQIYRSFEDFSEEFVPNILGGEVCLWTESAGGRSVEGKIWPRTAGLGERLWSDPATGWKEAETRMVHMRERLVERGIAADAIQPEWCHQNEDLCYLRKEDAVKRDAKND